MTDEDWHEKLFGAITQAQQRQALRSAQLQQQQLSWQQGNISALGRIMLHNQQRNALKPTTIPPEQPYKETQPNTEPPRVTVQDIFDYHLLKDNCVYCQRPHRRCPVHNVSQ